MIDDAFAQIVGSLDYPMIVVTACAGAERSGCLVGFHSQCSIEPCRWLVCLSKRNHTYRVAQRTQTLAVHFLRRGQRDLAQLFGGGSDDTEDKFARCAWRQGPHGTPILEHCNWIAGRVTERIDAGDHEGVVLTVFDGAREGVAEDQLGFRAVRGMKPGHAP